MIPTPTSAWYSLGFKETLSYFFPAAAVKATSDTGKGYLFPSSTRLTPSTRALEVKWWNSLFSECSQAK